MSPLRILYIASEVFPFLKTSKIANLTGQLPQAMQERGMEIRVLAPRFGMINERKNRLHEVVRLSGSHISVGGEEKSLIIKVASIPNARLQVYFIDNEDYFHRKSIFFDQDDNFHSDNDERLIFFCKGALETVKKLSWAPDIIHCSDWMTSLVPLYVKTIYRHDPVFSKAKCIFTLPEKWVNFKFSDDLFDKVKTLDMDDALLSPLKNKDYEGFVRLGVSYADAVTGISHDATWTDILSNQEMNVIEHGNGEKEQQEYYQLYQGLLEERMGIT